MGVALPILDANGAGAPPPSPARGRGGLLDSHGRVIRDLRLSVTDRCNFRCVYCMDPGVRFMPDAARLSVEQLVRVARVCVGLGVRKIRLTGGEPTLRADLVEIIEGVAALRADAAGLDLAITTNGALVDEAMARTWKRAGLSRVTVSLDSLREDRARAITRSATPPARVLEAVDACARAGLGPVKINAVVVRGFNDDEAPDLAALARERGVDVRFIEFMPLDSGGGWSRERVVPAEEILARIGKRFALEPSERADASETSLNFRFADGAPGRVGVIAPVSRPFCGACSRLRVTADGRVKPCLFSAAEWNLRPMLDEPGSAENDGAIARFLADATWTKQAGHGIGGAAFTPSSRSMSSIGG